jgi:hypothetical protein
LRQLVPHGTSLDNAFAFAGLDPKPDSVISSPTACRRKARTDRVAQDHRQQRSHQLFQQAVDHYPTSVPLNVILLPMRVIRRRAPLAARLHARRISDAVQGWQGGAEVAIDVSACPS